MEVIKYRFQQHGDERGQLVALEEMRDIPFEIKRVYYMYDTVDGVRRGYHAHRCLEQILIPIHGTCKIHLDNGRGEGEVRRQRSYWTSHMKAYILQIICGGKCMISPRMQC